MDRSGPKGEFVNFLE